MSRPLTWDDFRSHYESMTLGDATNRLKPQEWACACVGGPPGAPLGMCFCRLSYAYAGRLHRAAHIVARLLSDAARHNPGEQP